MFTQPDYYKDGKQYKKIINNGIIKKGAMHSWCFGELKPVMSDDSIGDRPSSFSKEREFFNPSICPNCKTQFYYTNDDVSCIKCGCRRRPFNYYKGFKLSPSIQHKSCYISPLLVSVPYCLSKLTCEVPRQIDFPKTIELYLKDSIGYNGRFKFSDDFGFPIINKKKLKVWVSKNFHKFMLRE